MSTRFMTKKDAVVEALREQVISGMLAPGTRLQQQDVAAQLDVSPTPVREAFLELASEGLLELRAHYGAVVATPKFDDLRDTYRVRGLIEVEALRLTVKHVDAKLIAELERHLEDGAVALRTLDSASYRRASSAFHAALIAASRSNVYVGLGRQLIARTTFPLERRLMAERQRDHKDLLQALRDRKWERAIAILKRHTERTSLVVNEIIHRVTTETKPPRGAVAARRPAKAERTKPRKKKRAR